MKRGRTYSAAITLLLFALAGGCGSVGANLAPADPPQSGLQSQSRAGQSSQIFTLTTSSPATYSTPSGALEPMESTSLSFQVENPGFVTISFSARGSVAPSVSQMIPIVFIECHIDGQPCQPDTNTVEFLYPQFCCDTRS